MRTCTHCGYDQTPDDMQMCGLCGEVFPVATQIGRASASMAQEKPHSPGAPVPTVPAPGRAPASSTETAPTEPRHDFAEDIRVNQQKSAVLLFLFVLLILALGWAVGLWFGSEEGGMAIALAVGLGMSFGAWFGGSKAILAITGAHEADPALDVKLINVVDEMRIAAGLPMPRVFIVEASEANAFATGRDPEHAAIAVTRGLLDILNREELQGVVAHEMSHVRRYDIRYMMLVAALVGTVVMVADLMRHWWWFGAFGGRRRGGRGNSSGNSGYIQLILLLVALLLILLAPLFASLLQMSISRKREYLADSGAVELTRNPLALASALNKIDHHVFSTALEARTVEIGPDERRVANRALQHLYIINPVKNIGEYTSNLFATHPPVRQRIERLRAMA